MTDHNEVESINGGSTLRYQVGQPAEAATYVQPEANRASLGGAMRYTSENPDGELVGAVTKFNAYTDTPAGSSIIATMRKDAMGVSVETEPGNPASRTLIQSAMRDGLVRQTGPGAWEDARQASEAPAVPQQGQQQAAREALAGDPGAGIFDPQDTADLLADLSDLNVPQFALDNTMARTIEMVAKGGDLSAISNQLSKDSAMAPEMAAALLQGGSAIYQRTADRAMASIGVSGDDLQTCYAWMREVKGPALRHSLQQFVLGRNVQPLKALASEWRSEQARKR